MKANNLDKLGLQFRPLRTSSDYLAMHAVRKACIEWDAIDVLCPEEQIPSVEVLKTLYPLSEAEKLPHTLRLVTINQDIIGYQTIVYWQHIAGIAYMQRLFLLPTWRDKGIEDAMLSWSEDTITKISAHHSAPKLARTFLSTTEKETNRLFIRHGYVAAGGLVSLALKSIQDTHTPLPNGFLKKPITSTHYHAIWAANERVFQDEPFRSPPIEENYQAFINSSGFDPSLWSVIWEKDKVAGVVFCEITENQVGVISQLSVGKLWRRRSLGSILVGDALHILKSRGVNKVYVATDVDNWEAIKLYKRFSFQPQREFVYYQKRVE